MAVVNRLLSSVLLATGVVLVFAGLSEALGFTALGVVASMAAIAALLYAGAAWFGAPPAMPALAGAGTITVFDRDLRVASGPNAGASILHAYPAAVRAEIEARCRAALDGHSTHFTCDINGRRVAIEAAPVVNAAGVIAYGILITGAGLAAPAIAAEAVATA